MSRLARALAALALVSAAGAALGYVRTTTNAGHPESGLWLWWGRRTLTFQINASDFASVPGCSSAAAAADLAAASFGTWAQAARTASGPACTDLAFVRGADTTTRALGNDGVNLVVFRKGDCNDVSLVPAGDPCHGSVGACASTYDCWEHGDLGSGSADTLALTTVTYLVGTGEIVDADMELHGWSGNATSPTGWYLTCAGPSSPTCNGTPYGKPSCNYVDVGNTVTHEAGHFIGFDHTGPNGYPLPYGAVVQGSVMAPSASPGDTNKRFLSADDIDGVCTVYPTGQPTVRGGPTGSGASGSSASGGGGCSSAGGLGALALLGAALGVWRRRSSRSR